jgi:hypothetical protein
MGMIGKSVIAAVLALVAVPAMARDLDVRVDCGAKGDGSGDDTAHIQACIDKAAASGQAVFVPTGVYRVSAPLRIANHNTTVYGHGAATTLLVQATPSAHIFVIANQGNPIDQITVSGLSLVYAGGDPAGFAILCTNCWRTYFRNLKIGRADTGTVLGTGIWVTGGNQVFVQDTVVTQAIHQALYFANVGDVFLSNVELNQPDKSTGAVGAVFDTGVGGIYAVNVNVTGGHTGFLFENTQNKEPPNFGFFTNCLADTLNGIGWNFQSAHSIRLTNSWAATAAVHGIVVKAVDGLSITDSRIYNNGADGIVVGPEARNLSIKSSTITGNSRLAPRHNYGIDLAAGAHDFQILDNDIGQSDGFGNTQAYGIYIAPGATDNYMIVGNRLNRNLAGGLENGATGTSRVVANNL